MPQRQGSVDLVAHLEAILNENLDGFLAGVPGVEMRDMKVALAAKLIESAAFESAGLRPAEWPGRLVDLAAQLQRLSDAGDGSSSGCAVSH